MHFCNNYPFHIVIYNLIYVSGRIRPYSDLYLVIQGHSFLLYYTVPCTGIMFHLVQFFKIPILTHLLRGQVRPVPRPSIQGQSLYYIMHCALPMFCPIQSKSSKFSFYLLFSEVGYDLAHDLYLAIQGQYHFCKFVIPNSTRVV